MAKSNKGQKNRPKQPAARKGKAPARAAAHRRKPAPAPRKKLPPSSASKPSHTHSSKGAATAKPAAPTASNSPAAPHPSAAGDRPRPKGITIVGKPVQKKPKVKKPIVMPNLGAPLLKPGGKKPKPLIASGPNAPAQHAGGRGLDTSKFKSHLPRKELDRYREILLRKRAELVGDVRTMEGQALQSSSGSLSHLPQHVADQGSDAYDQSLSLGLAQVDRNLIKEIDDALSRIVAGTFGICEVTGKPISAVRLDELPWTRVSIEGARERERRSHIV
ncbi:MAG: TraR/DksA family transcriptional regulator [Phycisphaerales bacterium]